MAHARRSKLNVSKLRQGVYERDLDCVVSGSLWAVLNPCGGALTIQHRVGKGMGGSSKRDERGEDLLAMCAIHNALEPASAEFRKACERNGWSVPRWAADQHSLKLIPVWYRDGWHLLDGFGRYALAHSTAMEMMFEIYGFGEEK